MKNMDKIWVSYELGEPSAPGRFIKFVRPWKKFFIKHAAVIIFKEVNWKMHGGDRLVFKQLIPTTQQRSLYGVKIPNSYKLFWKRNRPFAGEDQYVEE